MEGLKEPLEIVFKPVKRFTKRDLRPRTESDTSNPEPLNKEVILPTEPKEFENPFLCDVEKTKVPKTSITLERANGTMVEFDPEDYFPSQ